MNPAEQLILLGGTSSASGSVVGAALLLEDGTSYLLLEDGSKLLLE